MSPNGRVAEVAPSRVLGATSATRPLGDILSPYRLHGRAQGPNIADTPIERHYGNRRRSVLLTNASRRLSGDQDGTLIVPWPPYTYATTRALLPPSRVDITRRYTCL